MIDRCGVIAGPWQMGKVDQGVFSWWLLSHLFGRPLSYIGYGGSGKQVRDLLHIDDLIDLVDEQLGDPERWSGVTANVGGGRECSLSLLETTALCRELTGNEVAIGGVAETRPGDVPVYLSDCAQPAFSNLVAPEPWAARRPRRPARLVGRSTRTSCVPRWASSDSRKGGSESNAKGDSHWIGRPDRLRVRRRLVEAGYDVIGIENDTRAVLFGPEASTAHVTERLNRDLDASAPPTSTSATPTGVEQGLRRERQGDRAGRPHRRAALARLGGERPAGRLRRSTPTARSTCSRRPAQHCPEATFIFTSTNKVYGDRPNRLPLEELETRWSCPRITTGSAASTRRCRSTRTLHSLFGASKVAADLLVQEYGRYFDMPTVCFRGGCLTGPNHAGAQLHGFLAYLMKCTVTGDPYTVFGYEGKQVRDNIHAADLVDAFLLFHEQPAGGRGLQHRRRPRATCSMLEAIAICERIAGRELNWEMSDQARVGDHRWWISDLDEFGSQYGGWRPQRDLETILREIYEANAERWASTPA